MTNAYQPTWISKTTRRLIRNRRRRVKKKNNDTDVVLKRKIIMPMPNLTGTQGRKFRKDERRKARKVGKHVKFLVPKKKIKKPFPSIQKVLEENDQSIFRNNLNRDVERGTHATSGNDISNSCIALDCEMVGTGIGGKISALARVSLIDFNGLIILDTFVKVPSRVTDFRTNISGVTKNHIKEAMDLNRCRGQVGCLISEKIIIGHSLKHDLRALMLSHPKRDIRDTATYRPFMRLLGRNRYRPRKLKDLVREFVGKKIQLEGKSHDSVEDARAVMELYRVVRAEWESEVSGKFE